MRVRYARAGRIRPHCGWRPIKLIVSALGRRPLELVFILSDPRRAGKLRARAHRAATRAAAYLAARVVHDERTRATFSARRVSSACR
jgi:hypothetical protein